MAAALDIRQWIVTEVASYYYGNYGIITDDDIDLIVSTALTILRGITGGDSTKRKTSEGSSIETTDRDEL